MVDCNLGESAAPAPNTTALLEDWITLWQSEMAGLVLDREWQETLLRWVDGVADQARAVLATVPLDARAPGPVPPPGPAPPSAPPHDARPSSSYDDDLARLHRRIAELERRLATLESPGP